MNSVSNSRFAVIADDGDYRPFLRLEWRPESEGMSLDDFKETLNTFANFVLEKGVEAVLIDTRALRFRVDPGAEDWLQQTIVPKYNRVLKRCACLTNESSRKSPYKGEAFLTPTQVYFSKYFSDEADAIQWAFGSHAKTETDLVKGEEKNF